MSSWIRVGFVSTEPQGERPALCFKLANSVRAPIDNLCCVWKRIQYINCTVTIIQKINKQFLHALHAPLEKILLPEQFFIILSQSLGTFFGVSGKESSVLSVKTSIARGPRPRLVTPFAPDSEHEVKHQSVNTGGRELI